MTMGWIFAVWLVGWLLAVRPSMRRTMLQEVCSGCAHLKCSHDECRCPCSRYGRVPRGAMRERTGGDVAASVWFAAWWPIWLTIVLLRKASAMLGAGVKTAVLRATPLTGPELERRLKERQAEIARLTQEIGEKS